MWAGLGCLRLRNKHTSAHTYLGAANHNVEIGQEGVHLVHDVALHSLGPLLAAVGVRQQRHEDLTHGGGRGGVRRREYGA